MNKLLKIGASLSVISANIYAASINASTDNKTGTTCASHSASEVFLSSPDYCFAIEFDALFLQPTGSNLHYAAEAQPLPAPTPQWMIHEVKTDYHFGFDVGLRGMFHSTNTNLALNWEHFHSTDTTSTQLAATDMIGPFFEIGPDAAAYTQASGKAAFHFDEANLNYGIYVNFGNRLETNLFSAVSFARVKQTIVSKYSNADGTTHRSIEVPSTFMGAGPQLGMDFTYRIVQGFNFVGKVATSLLVGTLKNHTIYKSYSPLLADLDITPPNLQKTHVHNKTQVVPAIDGKLGISYVFTFCKHYMLALEAGYKAQVYIDAIQSVDMGSEVVTPPFAPDIVGVYARTFEQNTSNFALAGPYLTLSLGF